MKAVILAGGLGTRLGSLTENIPKPMVRIGQEPLIVHVMRIFAKHGISEFVIAAGYKAEVIKRYFVDFHRTNGDIAVDLKSGAVTQLGDQLPKWRVTIVDSGEDTLTGSRLKTLRPILGESPFLLTYGDGVANVDISALLEFHRRKERLATLTAVRPVARFGELSIESGVVSRFEEKPQLVSGWVNGGFMVLEPSVFDYIPDQNVMLEREPLENISSQGELAAFQHEGFWQCMDTKRDLDYLQNLWSSGTAPWA